MGPVNGVTLYAGPSALDGSEIIVVLTGLRGRSANAKTGDMLQTWILLRDIPPHVAVREGRDAPICGDCPLGSGEGCYVRVEQAPLAVWKAWHRGNYPLAEGHETLGRKLRVGAYGDPAAVPWIWSDLAGQASGNSGYTHQWRHTPVLAPDCMASVHTPEERLEAKLMGFRTFRTGADGPVPGEIICPATPEGGEKTNCDRCGLCAGSKRPARDVFAYLHGSKKKRALLAIGG
jgi:hypothetical protein